MYPQKTAAIPCRNKPRRYKPSWQDSSDAPILASPSPKSTKIPPAIFASEPQQIRCFRRKSSAIPLFAASRKTSPAGCGWQSSASRAKNALKSFFCFLGRFLTICLDQMRSQAARPHAAGLGSRDAFLEHRPQSQKSAHRPRYLAIAGRFRNTMRRLTARALRRDKIRMAKIKVERGLHLGTPYTPEMQTGGKRPEPTWSTIREQVREAEALGYDTILAVETQHDPYLELAIAAQEPSKIELATGIALAVTRSAVATAYTAWDLQRMSGGRLSLGLGSQVKGHVMRRFGMPWAKPAQRMKDYVGAMRACWKTWQTGEPLDFRSEHYNLSLMTPNFSPPPNASHPQMPLLIAAVQDRVLQFAGEVSDGEGSTGIVPLER